MRIRDAVESDAEALATAIDRPRDAVIDMIHDRSVRVAVSDGGHDGESIDGISGDGKSGDGNSGDGKSGDGSSSDEDSDGESTDDDGWSSESDDEIINGFIAFDVHNGAVHVTDFDGQVTDLDGGERLIRRLFEEPRRFARGEGLAVEVVLPDDEGSSGVIEEIGFDSMGPGPRFDGRATTRYRIESEIE